MSQSQESPTTPQSKPRRKSRQQLSSTQVMFAVILAIAMMLAVQFSSRISSERDLTLIRESILEEIDFLQREQSTLIQELDFVQSDAYVEQWARGEGRMVQEDMVLVVPEQIVNVAPAQATPNVEVITSPIMDLETTLPDPEPWQLWWALFFDTQPPQLGA